MELPEQLKAHRERMGLSQEEIARRIFVSRQTMSNWETGKTYPDVQSLLLLSNLFGVSIDELVKGDVETMKDVVSKDAVKLERYTWVEIILVILAVVNAGLWRALYHNESEGIISFSMLLVSIALLAGAVLFACKAESIKKKHDLVAYREIVAFMNGENLDAAELAFTHSFTREHPVMSTIMKFIAGAAVGLILAVALIQLMRMVG